MWRKQKCATTYQKANRPLKYQSTPPALSASMAASMDEG
jgi:hypothetical protein